MSIRIIRLNEFSKTVKQKCTRAYHVIGITTVLTEDLGVYVLSRD